MTAVRLETLATCPKSVASIDENANPCFPYERIVIPMDAGQMGNKMIEYATLIATATMTGHTPIPTQVIIDLDKL